MLFRVATGVGALSLVFILLIAVSFSMIVGVGLAYDVDDRQNATVEWNGTHMQLGPESVEFLPSDGESWEDFESDDTREEPDDEIPEELQPYLDELEGNSNVGPDLSATAVGEVYTNTVSSFITFALNSMLTVVGLLGTAYTEFFYSHRNTIPEWLAEAYVWTYVTTLYLSFFYTKIKAIRT